MKKLTFALFLLTMLSAGSWFALRYAPEKIPFLAKPAATEPTLESPTPAEYMAWRDSLDRIDILVRTEQDPRVLRLQKEQQRYYWNKLKSARAAIVIPVKAPEASVQVSSDPQAEGLVKFLSKVLTIAAIVLALIIVILLLLLRRKNSALTKHLDTLQADDRFQGSRAGVLDAEPTRIPVRKAKSAYIPSPNTLPDTAALDLSALAEQISANARQSPNTQAIPNLPPLRPTARQRVTTALKGLAEALSTLKSDTPSDAANDPSKSRVRSQNNVRSTQASQILAPSRFEREREENSEIIKLARRGFTSSEIARRLRVPQDQVETVVRMQRNGE